jgi:mRNA interferase RelE/StbE
VIYRVAYDDSGIPIIDVAEVWAIGAGIDNEVYEEMRSRVESLPKNPRTMALSAVVARRERWASNFPD